MSSELRARVYGGTRLASPGARFRGQAPPPRQVLGARRVDGGVHGDLGVTMFHSGFSLRRAMPSPSNPTPGQPRMVGERSFFAAGWMTTYRKALDGVTSTEYLPTYSPALVPF